MNDEVSRRVFIGRSVTAGIGLAGIAPLLSGCSTPRGSGALVLAREGAPNASIVISGGASVAERTAASELATYLRKITGATFPIGTSAGQGPTILVGKGAGDLGREGFRIRTEGGNLHLAGADDAGVEFAVYTFLEKYLGVRWLWPGELGEVVPRQSTLTLGAIDDAQVPDFVWRDRGPAGALWGANTGPTEMHAREILLGVTPEHQAEVRLWEKRNKWGGLKVYGGHALGEMFPPEKYARTHPEYYALVKGKRDVPPPDWDYKHGSQICTTEPGVIAAAIQWVNDFYDANPDYDAVHITMNDGGGFCECDRCRALDTGKTMADMGIGAEEAKGADTRRVITDRIFTYVNQVTEGVQKKHPGKYVMSMAYGAYITPPERVKLHPYVIPQYTLWSAYKHSNPAVKREHEGIAEGWAKAAKHAAIYEYYINGSWPGLHRLVVPQIANSLRKLKQQGIRQYQVQSGDEFGVNGLNYYVGGKLLWDTTLDENALLDDFYAKGFGSAAPAVRRFHDRMAKAWADATRGGVDVSMNSLQDTRVLELFTPELLRSAAADLDAATTAASGDETVRARVDFYRKGLRYTDLTVDAVRAAKAAGPLTDRRLVSELLAATLRLQEFADGLKNDYVLPYFWVRYNREQRDFLPSVSALREQLGKIG